MSLEFDLSVLENRQPVLHCDVCGRSADHFLESEIGPPVLVGLEEAEERAEDAGWICGEPGVMRCPGCKERLRPGADQEEGSQKELLDFYKTFHGEEPTQHEIQEQSHFPIHTDAPVFRD